MRSYGQPPSPAPSVRIAKVGLQRNLSPKRKRAHSPALYRIRMSLVVVVPKEKEKIRSTSPPLATWDGSRVDDRVVGSATPLIATKAVVKTIVMMIDAKTDPAITHGMIEVTIAVTTID